MRRSGCAIAIAVAACLFIEMIPVGAAERKEAVPPKDWDGRIRASHLSSAAALFFEQNGCDWAGAEGLNGADSLIWDVKEYAGLKAKTSWSVSQPNSAPQRLSGYFIDENCQRISGVLWGHDFATADKWQTIVIPETAVWSVVQATFIGVSPDIDVRMHSDGYTPPVKKKKKKKKKKRSRR